MECDMSETKYERLYAARKGLADGAGAVFRRYLDVGLASPPERALRQVGWGA